MTYDASTTNIHGDASASSYSAKTSGGSPLVDLLSLLGGVNPLATAGKLLETVVSMSSEMIQSVSTFNDTMLEMNRMAHRMNSLLDEIEGPVRQVALSQAKGTMKKVDAVIGQIGSLPSDVAKAVSTLGDLASRLGPLAQFAESAGGLFGIKSGPS
jgi:enamine deaminase RidA (YjgF/YER057c/UK114 family)